MFYFNQTKTGAIFPANLTLSPDLGPRIRAGGGPPSLSDLQSQLLAAGTAADRAQTGTISSMQSGVHVYSVHGIGHSDEVRIELTSTDPLPAGGAPIILRIGSNFVLTGNLVDLYRAVFTLTPTEYAATKDGDP